MIYNPVIIEYSPLIIVFDCEITYHSIARVLTSKMICPGVFQLSRKGDPVRVKEDQG